MTPEQFEALEAWISDMIHPQNNDLRASYLKARKLFVVEPAKEIVGTGCQHSTGYHIHNSGYSTWSCCGERVA